MAIINKTGITDGGTIQSEHVTRAIDALSGVSTDTVVATGSFTGSFQGILTGTVNGNSSTATEVNTAAGADNSTHYVLFANNTTGNQTLLTDSSLTINPSTNAVTVTGSLNVSGSTNSNISATATSKINLSAISSSGYFALPLSQPSNPVTGSVYVDFTAGNFAIWDGATWRSISF
jgi:hypothetical protein